MCLVAFAWRAHPRFHLVVAANRDEFHERPTAALGWWTDDPRILAGRDQQAAGTWMGMERSGRFGLMTNFRDLETPPPDTPSRGSLVAEFLKGSMPARDYLDKLAATARRFAGFSLVIGDSDSIYYFSNRDGSEPRPLAPGVYGLSNHSLDSPWPKVTRTRARLTEAVGKPDIDSSALFEMLADRTITEDAAVPRTGLPAEWERRLSAAFVLHESYGTRCSTVMLSDNDDRCTVFERRFDSAGCETGRTRIGFDRSRGSDVSLESSPGRGMTSGELPGDSSPE